MQPCLSGTYGFSATRKFTWVLVWSRIGLVVYELVLSIMLRLLHIWVTNVFWISSLKVTWQVLCCSVLLIRSTTLDSWNQDQLRVMSCGGNGRARVFFKQYGWTEGGRIESKYISRAAELYRQLLAKEVSKGVATASLAQSASPANGHSTTKADDFFFVEQKVQQPAAIPVSAPVPALAPAPVARPASSNVTRKPTSSLGAKKLVTGRSGGGLGVRKLTTKVQMCSFSRLVFVKITKMGVFPTVSWVGSLIGSEVYKIILPLNGKLLKWKATNEPM